MLNKAVQEHNQPARALYGRLGFTDGRYEPQAGRVLFREKGL
jgi:ribosomal protein S18 acetylase RimI-like enzyme